MLLLLDIGNTHTHLGLANANRVLKQKNIPTEAWKSAAAGRLVKRFVGGASLNGAALCSVVPQATPLAARAVSSIWGIQALPLTVRTLRGVGVRYPKPETIGPDRLANAVAVRHHFGAPAIVVDFGTAVTFDVVDRAGNYIGGIIAPGLAAMTEYLHEKTSLLPRIKIREVRRAIGKSTEEAMQIGAVHGYRGFIKTLILEVRRELGARRVPVIATGGYAALMASKIPEINSVEPLLTLEGLRLLWNAHFC